jgi:hypothetical protein
MLCKYLNDIYENHIKANLIDDEFEYYYPIENHFLDLWNHVDIIIKKHPDRDYDLYFIDNKLYFIVDKLQYVGQDFLISHMVIDVMSKKYLMSTRKIISCLRRIIYKNGIYDYVALITIDIQTDIENYFNKDYVV